VNTQHWTDRLSEYLDAELAANERAACDAHLEVCEQCRAVLEELRAVVQIAHADTDVLPKSDLWPAIVSRMGNDVVAGRTEALPFVPRSKGTTASGLATSRRQISFTLPQLALAASLLIAVSAGVAFVAAGRTSTTPVAQEDPIQAQAEPLLPSTGAVERANFADAQFNQAVADLERVLTDRRDELDPRTVLIIERNLAAIDQAIREARAALDADPANTFLNSHLADARQKKLELLRQATMLQTPSGD
jgi:hypothetical protein